MQVDDRDLGMLAIVLVVLIAVVGAAFGVDSKVPELGIAAIAGFVTGQRRAADSGGG